MSGKYLEESRFSSRTLSFAGLMAAASILISLPETVPRVSRVTGRFPLNPTEHLHARSLLERVSKRLRRFRSR